MRLKLQLVLSIMALFTAGAGRAQVSAYNFVQTIGSYGSALTGTFLGTNYQNDTAYMTSLPFPFDFNGTVYNSVYVSSNGFLSFNPVTGNEHNPISDPSTQNVISAFGQDLHSGMMVHCNLTNGSNTITNVSFPAGISVGDSIFDYNGDFGITFPKIVAIFGNNLVLNSNAQVNSSGYDLIINNGAIRQTLAGSTPTRVCEFEYQNFSRFNVFDEVVNFKIRLHEINKRVEVVYGSAVPGTSITTSEIGLKGSSNADFNSRKVSGTDTYITSQAATLITQACEVSPSKMPSGDIAYYWQPYCSVPGGFTVTQSSDTICAGQSVTLTASQAMTYSVNGMDTAAVVVLTPTSDTTYHFVGQAYGCTSTVTLLQVVGPDPVISGTSNQPVVCSGDQATLTASGGVSYTWSTNDQGASATVTPTGTTTYTVKGANIYGCMAEAYVTVTAQPLPDIKFTQSHSISCKGELVSITASGGTTYSWNTGATSSALLVLPNQTTTYTVTVTSGSCSAVATIEQKVKDCTGIGENQDDLAVFAYPNPFGGELSLSGLSPAGWSLSVTDITGKVIYRTAGSQIVTSIQTGEWNSGLYFITISDGERSVVRKLVKD